MSELRKTISVPALIAIGAAGVIGSSWLYLGSEFFADFGAGGTILGFIIATALAACVALAYSALANRMPRAGGEIVYAVVAGNSFLGFIVGWLLIGAYASMVAFYVTATGRLLSTVWPELNSVALYSVGGETIFLPIIAIGFALTLIVLAMNWFGAEFSSRAQLALFSIMVIFAAAVVVAGFARGSFDNFWPMFDSASETSPVVSTLSFVLPAFSFLTGFGVVAILAEEARASAKRIGQIVVLSVVLAGAFYTIVLLATAWLLPWEEIAGMTNGTIEAFDVAGMPLLSTAAFLIGALGIVTTFIAVFSASSRLMFALARIELLPPMLHKLDSKTGTPRNALLFTTGIGLVLGLLGPGALVWFLNTIGVFIAIVWAVTVWAYYRLRSQGGLGPQPSRSWTTLLPAVGGIASVVIVFAALIPASPMSLRWPFEYLIFIGWIALGVVLYFRSPRRMPRTDVLRSLLGDYYDRQFGQTDSPTPPVEDRPVR